MSTMNNTNSLLSITAVSYRKTFSLHFLSAIVTDMELILMLKLILLFPLEIKYKIVCQGNDIEFQEAAGQCFQ